MISSPIPALEQAPLTQRGQDNTRKVGVELEFGGITARRAAEALATGLGGSVVEEDPHAFLVRGTQLGDTRVEVDLRHTHPQRNAATRLRLGPRSAAWLGAVLRHMVPTELVTAPIPISRQGRQPSGYGAAPGWRDRPRNDAARLP